MAGPTGQSSGKNGQPATTASANTKVSAYSDADEASRLASKASSFKHDISNNAASAKEEDIVLKFQPNILDNYDAITYHFKLFIVSTAVSASGNIFNAADQTVIAESGVTDLTIDNVQLDGIPVPSVATGTGTMTGVKFEIVEPAGAGLMDKIFYEAVALGIGNWFVMPMYLQLSFRARDPVTGIAGSESSGGLGNLSWVWPVKISNTKAHVSEIGTRYAFEAVLYNEVAQSNAYFSMQHNASLTNIDKFGTAMTELEQKLNDDQLLKLIDNYSIADTYTIIVDPVLASYSIKPAANNKDSQRNDSFVTFSDKSASFNSGTGIDKVIDGLLSNTEEYQKLMTDAPRAGADGEPLSTEKTQMKKIWRIITETIPVAFDARRQDNAKHFYIYIIQYDIGVLDANAEQSTNPDVSKDASIKRLSAYTSKNILKKKYNYIFTGLNDQILQFDLVLENAFATAVARFDARYLNASINDHGPSLNKDNTADKQKVQGLLAAAMSFQFDSSKATSAEAQKAIAEYQAAIKTSYLSSETVDRFNTLLEQSKPASKLNFLKQNQAGNAINSSGTLEQNVQTATSLATPLSSNVPRFISDVDINSAAAQSKYSDFISSGIRMRPIAMIETSQDKAVGAGIEPSSNAGISKVSSVFSLALHSGSGDANLQQIKMTIKGDPFWLYPQPVSVNTPYYNFMKSNSDAITFLKGAQSTYENAINPYGTDNFILVRFRTPRYYNTDSNASDGAYTDSNIFSGIYRVIGIKSSFVMGKFSQELSCILDPIINIRDIANVVEKSMMMADVPATAGDLLGISQLPVTSIKTDKLATRADMLEQNIRNGIRTNMTLSDVASAQETYRQQQLGLKPSDSNIPTPYPNVVTGLPPTYSKPQM